MSPRIVAAGVSAFLALLFAVVVFNKCFDYNHATTWQVYQPMRGAASIVDKPGWYWKGFGSVTTYPRMLEASYLATADRDESIRTTFNDGGTAQVSAFVRVKLPLDSGLRMQLHQDFQGNPENIKPSIGAHLTNCIKASGPVMSASENQASRKAEFNQIIEEQLSRGLFKMRRTKIELDDVVEIADAGTDKDGNKVTEEKKAVVAATEIIVDKDGTPIIIQPSPLLTYDLQVKQFSVLDIDYDQQTLLQFAAKKQSYLNAEQSKAQLQEEVQQALTVREKGLRQIAEIQAVENQKKEKALIEAAQQAEVAEITKKQAVTQASQRVEVAEQSRLEAEKFKEIARIEAETAELKKQRAISEAEAKKQAIEIGGSLSERDRVLAEIEREKAIGVAAELAKTRVPGVVISGGGEGAGETLGCMIQYLLLKHNGLLPSAEGATP